MLLEARGIHSGYGDVEILHGVSVCLDRKEVVTMIGPNGSGKSTLLKTVMGYLKTFKGDVYFNSEKITDLETHERVRKGIGYSPQLENVFPTLTVQENLELGGYLLKKEEVGTRIKEMFDLFPILKERKKQEAGTLSGGERQMLALGKALMLKPAVLLLDEPSAALAPGASRALFGKISEIRELGISILMVEQDAYQSLSVSDRGYVLVEGKIRIEDESEKILKNSDIRKAYLGG